MVFLILLLFILPFIEAPEYPVYAEEGNTQSIPCAPASLTAEDMVDIEYLWMASDGKPVSTKDRYFTEEDGTLEIIGVVSQDAGELVCQVVYGDVESGMVRKERLKYVLTVYTLPLMLTYVTINYRINSCQDEYDNNIWKEIFNTALRMEVCRDDMCNVQHFDMKCLDIQEEQRSTDVLTHEIIFNATIRVSHSTIPPCNLTCTVGKLYDYVQLIVGKLNRYTETQTGQLASFPSLGFHVVKGSLQTRIQLGCTAGNGLRGDICVACEPGTYSHAEATNCSPCGKGFYEPNYAASQCTKCPKGHHSYKPGAKDIRLCHSRGTMTYVIVISCIATIVTLLVSGFFIFKLIKKRSIKSHGVKLPGLDFGPGVDLLENMHEIEDETPKKKPKKKRLRFEKKLSLISEEHTPLIADDIGSPRESAALVLIEEVQQETTKSEPVVLVIDEDKGSIESGETEMAVWVNDTPEQGEKKRVGKPKRDHGEKTVSSTESESSSDSESISTFSDSDDSSSYTYSSGSESVETRGREASAVFIPDASEEHTPIFPTERVSSGGVRTPDAHKSHSILMLHRSRDTFDTASVLDRTSRTPSKTSSRMSRKSGHHHSDSRHASPSVSVSSRHSISQKRPSFPDADKISHTSPSQASNLHVHDTSIHRTPSVSRSAQLTVRRSLSDGVPETNILPPRSSLQLLTKRPSSTARLPPPPPLLNFQDDDAQNINDDVEVHQSGSRLYLVQSSKPSLSTDLPSDSQIQNTDDNVAENAPQLTAPAPPGAEGSTGAPPNPPLANSPAPYGGDTLPVDTQDVTASPPSPVAPPGPLKSPESGVNQEFFSCASEMETSPPNRPPPPEKPPGPPTPPPPPPPPSTE